MFPNVMHYDYTNTKAYIIANRTTQKKEYTLSKQHMRFIRKEGMRKDNIAICCHCTGRNKMDQNEGDRKRTKDERNMTGRQRAEGRPSLHQ